MKVTIEIYPKEIKKLLELLDLIDKKPEYIYKVDSSKSQEPIPIDNHEVKKSVEPFSSKISDMPYKSVKYNEKEPLPNKEFDHYVQKVANYLSEKEKLTEANELEELIEACKQELEERHNELKENNKKIKDEDSSTIKFDIPFHDGVSNINENESKQFKKDLEKLFDEVFGTDDTKD